MLLAMRAVEAVLCDLDGVLTPTADAHRRAWARLFAEVFSGDRAGVAPYTDDDYANLVDGRPRCDGVRAVLAARGLRLPEGSPDDDGLASVHGLGNRKNAFFRQELARGLAPYPGSARFLDALAAARVPVAVVSSSRNAAAVLRAAGLAGRFAVVVDGQAGAELGLAGKPAPDTFVEAASRLGVPPARAMVAEDAISGVAAGRAGGFGLVVGVDRSAGTDPRRKSPRRAALLAAGADVVVTELDELIEELA